jgi:hypothetical protein
MAGIADIGGLLGPTISVEAGSAGTSWSQLSRARGLSAPGTGAQQDSVTISREAVAAQKGILAQGSTSNVSPQEQAEIRKLQQVDREVRQHEQAHLATAGGYARGGANYTYATGPDGKRYATGGEVSIDVSPSRTPQATISKMETVKRAALAPANPSAQDRAVYAAAVRAEVSAEQQLAKQRTEVQQANNPSLAALAIQGTAVGSVQAEGGPNETTPQPIARPMPGQDLAEQLLRGRYRNVIRDLEPQTASTMLDFRV